GPPKLDESKCVKCGTCVKVCPYDVIKFGSTGFPEWDINSCLGCCRCFNKCPHEAIDFPKVYGSLRSKYPKPDFTKVGVGNGKNSKGEIMQPLPKPSELVARMSWKP
ncbi:MAG: 4Fe-4S cluster domain-containing protein, partial [Streblomastix strix]